MKNTEGFLRMIKPTVSQTFTGQDKLALISSQCSQPQLKLKKYQVDMDGLFVACRHFSSIRLQITNIYFKSKVSPAKSIVGKTQNRDTLRYALFLTELGGYFVHLMSFNPEPLTEFKKEFQRQMKNVPPAEFNRPSILRNAFNLDRMKVMPEDVEYMLKLLDKALTSLRHRHPLVSNAAMPTLFAWLKVFPDF